MKKSAPKTIDAYIARFPAKTQALLKSVRKTIHQTAPQAEETISYQIPTFRLRGKNLVHFAAYERHIGLYPTRSGIIAFKKELSPYKSAAGSVQFPIGEPLPLRLIGAIVKFRVKEVTAQTG